MPLVPGSRLESYEILAPIGAGGMGEVYRARDPNLARDVAIKVLPERLAQDAEALARFQREAQAVAALSHPHILSIFEFGSNGGVAYAVMELLEGTTLREKVSEAPLPARKAAEYAVQIADGLAVAHEKGIVHRDLKPENVFVTRDGRVKILDFGLALFRPRPEFDEVANSPTLSRHTDPGTILGTVAYMSPEQVRGDAVDHRTDIFSLGAMLFEMVGGERPFRGDSQVETMHAILKRDPPEFGPTAAVPAGLERIIRHCLEKSPAERFQSARDLAFDLRALSTPSAPGVSGPAQPRSGNGTASRIAAAVVLLGVGVVAGLWIGREARGNAPPTMKRLTFERGTVEAARFLPGSQNVLYSARWQGRPPSVFQVRADSPESRPLGLANASLLAVSSSEELALKLSPRMLASDQVGRLARAPIGGAGIRELLDGVIEADWLPDGNQLAVLRMEEADHRQIEFPPGHVLHKTAHPIHDLRFSPRGDRIAFAESDVALAGGVGFQSLVSVVDLKGNRKVLTTATICSGLAWGPANGDLWFTESDAAGGSSTLWAVGPGGRQRLVWRVPGRAELVDVAVDGRVLLKTTRYQNGLMGRPPGVERETDLSWLDGSFLGDLSSDGRTLLLTEGAAAGGKTGSIYLRRMDGTPAVRLGAGTGYALSPDGRLVLASPPDSASRLVLIPTGAGDPREIRVEGIDGIDAAYFLGNGSQILVSGHGDNGDRFWLVGKEGGKPRPVTPPGTTHFIGEQPVSPDQKLIAAASTVVAEWVVQICPLDGGEPSPVPGLGEGDIVSGWAADNKTLYVFNREALPARVYRVNMHSGHRELWRELMPPDPAGVTGVRRVLITPDGRTYAYGFPRTLSELYLIEGLR
jgi:eukaryotic-like serine/threonine-protein kinase